MSRLGRVRHALLCGIALGLMPAAGCGLFGSGKAAGYGARRQHDAFEAAYRMVLEGHYEEAVGALSVIAKKKAASNTRRPDAMFWLAYAYAEQGLLLEAGHWYGRYLEKYPRHRYAETARDRLKELEQAGL